MERPIEFRNVVRYVRDVAANVPLYEALGFQTVRAMGEDMVIMKGGGISLVLHSWQDRPVSQLDTALGFTITGTIEEARRYVEEAGFRCLREPEEGDAGFFYIYGDLDGNPINLVHPPQGSALPRGGG